MATPYEKGRSLPSQSRLREVLEYDPQSGIFRSLSHRKGKVVGWTNAAGYVGIWVDGRTYYAHRLVWLYVYGRWPERDTDHINGIKHDNRLTNLREATRTQNNGNARRRRDNPGLKGTRFRRDTGRWTATIRHNGRTVPLGCFPSKEDAHAAYCVAAKAYFGEFARFE